MSNQKNIGLKESTFKDQPDLELLDEVKMPFIYDKFSGTFSVGMVSAFQNHLTTDANRIATTSLAFGLRSIGFGIVFVDGEWIESEGSGNGSPHKCETSVLVIAGEGHSELLFESLIKSAQRYCQKGFIFKGPHLHSSVSAFDSKGKKVVSLKCVNIEMLSHLYSELQQGVFGSGRYCMKRERLLQGYIAKLTSSKSMYTGHNS